MSRRSLAFSFCLLQSLGAGGCQLLIPQSDTWNSTFTLSQQQIDAAGLSSTKVHNVNVAIQFERTNWAGGSVYADPFYQAAPNSSHLPPGSLLTLEDITNTSLYTLPPNVALSRITFQSEDLNGTRTPASAYILWPWMARGDPKVPGKYAVVGWAHGTSGGFGECAPSHIRNLWYQYSGPYIAALQGYVVVAPDYAGLGITRDASGREIKHQYVTSPAGANDLFHSITAAREAFPRLSTNFVLLGHSQGGGVAWAAAQRQAKQPVEGYLGSIAVSPITNHTTALMLYPEQIPLLGFLIANHLDTIFPDFSPSTFLTDKGIKRLEFMRSIDACNSAAFELIADPGLVKENLLGTEAWQNFVNLAVSGGRPIARPLLVLQGTADSLVAPDSVTAAVNNTCAADPNSALEYQVLEGVDHVPTMYAGQRVWLDWIADRFAGRQAAPPCTVQYYEPTRPMQTYQKEVMYYLELARQSYQVA